MANEALVQRVKGIVAHVKSNDWDGLYAGYQALFADPEFSTYPPADQRTALKLMVLQKGAPQIPTPAMKEAHRAALPALTELVSNLGDPADHELLGVCHVVLGNEESASAIFKAGLAIERERNPASDLCGALMRRVASI
ncbi:MAG TPA: hypothetical protein VHE30_12235 [Polyangiaceae bacterium]|nr:hypothetical protein [Polyangiaceae bacterium]